MKHIIWGIITILMLAVTVGSALALPTSYDIVTTGFNIQRTRNADGITGNFVSDGDFIINTSNTYTFLKGSSGYWQPLTTDLNGDGKQEIIMATGGCFDYYPSGLPSCVIAPSGISTIDVESQSSIYDLPASSVPGDIEGIVLVNSDGSGNHELGFVANHTFYIYEWNTGTDQWDLVASTDVCGGVAHCQAKYASDIGEGFANMACQAYNSSHHECWVNRDCMAGGCAPGGKFSRVYWDESNVSGTISADFYLNSSSPSFAVCNLNGNSDTDIVVGWATSGGIHFFELNESSKVLWYGGQYRTTGGFMNTMSCEDIDAGSHEVYLTPTPSTSILRVGSLYEGSLTSERFQVSAMVGNPANNYAFIDVSGDGDYDICSIGGSPGALTISRCFNKLGTIVATNYTRNVAGNMMAGDFADNDGAADVFTTFNDNHMIGMVVNDNTDHANNPYEFNSSGDGVNSNVRPSIGFGDFNGDGAADVFISTSGFPSSTTVYISSPLPISGIDTSCPAPCVFSDTFSYYSSVTNAGWGATSASLATANGTHLVCDGDEFAVSRVFPPLSISDQTAVLTYSHNMRGNTSNSFTYLDLQNELGEVVISLIYVGSTNKIVTNYEERGATFTTGTSHNYSILMNFVHNQYDLYQDGAIIDSIIPFFSTVNNRIGRLILSSSITATACDWDYDHISLTKGTVPIEEIPPVNESAGLYWQGALVLNMNNPGFDTSYCLTDESTNKCFFRLATQNIGGGIVDWILGNILIVLAFTFIMLLISTVAFNSGND